MSANDKRKSARSAITRLANEAKALIQSETRTVDELQEKLDRLKVANERLKEATNESLPFLEEDKREKEWDVILEYEGTAASAIGRLERVIRSMEERIEVRTVVSSPSTSAGTARTNAKLPKIEIKKFSGETEKWIPFWEMYNRAVHENDDLEDCEKFAYLQTYVIGKAARTLEGLTPTSACYKEAIELLKRQYGREDRITEGLLRKIITLKRVRDSNDVEMLRSNYNDIMSIVRSLRVMKVPINQYALALKTSLLKSMPDKMCLDFRRKMRERGKSVTTEASSDNSAIAKEVEELIDLLREEVELIEEHNEGRPSERRNPAHSVRTEFKPSRERKVHRESSTFSTSGLITKVAAEACMFCDSTVHESKECNANLTIDVKKERLAKMNRCFKCTKRGHGARFCKSFVRCAKCGRRHITALCDPEYFNELRKGGATTAAPEEPARCQANLVMANKTICLGTAAARISHHEGGGRTAVVRMLLDSGSETTFICERVSRHLGLKIIGTHNISIAPFGSTERPPARLCNKVRLNLKSRHTNEAVELTAIEVPTICVDAFEFPNDKCVKVDLKMADVNSALELDVEGISILIGADSYWRVVTGNVQRIKEGLVAIETRFGWAMHGAYENDSASPSVSALSIQVEDLEVAQLWDLEAIGIKPCNEEAEEFTREFRSNAITYKDYRYTCRLPWKSADLNLHSNYGSAKSRLLTLVSKLKRNDKLNEYDAIIKEYVQAGIAERVSSNLEQELSGYYMPHRAIYREDKETTKVRIVFDASSHIQGQASLNESLHVGMGMIPDIVHILLRFRVHEVGMIADIEKAFLQIKLAEEDQDYHRFLWIEKGEIVTYRMKRVTFGVASGPFILSAVINEHLAKYDCGTARLIKDSIYVDDVAMGADTVEEAKVVHSKAIQIMNEASMPLRKWHSNDQELRRAFQDEAEEQKVLGVCWRLITDELSVDTSSLQRGLQENSSPTKRSLLQAIARIFDPMGMITPFTIRAKILMQDVWKKKLEWDRVLDEDLQLRWHQWVRQAKIIDEFQIRRNIMKAGELPEMHVFCDASQRAYGAVVYLKGSSIEFVMSRARVAPIKTDSLTLPRLELTAALIGARLARYITQALTVHFASVHLWTDSTIALHWIKGNPKRWKQYVANRVREIQTLTAGMSWAHCPGKSNPADLLTRGCDAEELVQSELWRRGPPWLATEDWASATEEEEIPQEEVASFLVAGKFMHEVEPIVALENFSSFRKLIGVTCMVYRFLRLTKGEREGQSIGRSEEEQHRAENYWIKWVQSKYYYEEVNQLAKKKTVPKHSTIWKLNPFLDESGLLRVTGRIQESVMTFDETHPIILPPRSQLDKLMVQDLHQRSHHGGVGMILSRLRRRYWLVRGRQIIKSVLAKCVVCQRLRKAGVIVPTGPLPRERLQFSRPFEQVGIDFAGPLYTAVESCNEVRKTYILLITCANIRAVHLELVYSMSTDSFIMAMRRFIARRGVPKLIVSDNALTFKKAAKDLAGIENILRSEELGTELSSLQIKWKFNVQLAPWWGGFWERMVRTVKTALRASLGRRTPGFDELRTILTEVEATINTRPLTYMGSDPADPKPLTPADFLNGPCLQKIPFTDKEEAANVWTLRERCLRSFTKRWYTEYLQQLKSAHEQRMNDKGGGLIKQGGLVLIIDHNLKRIQWKMARVEKLFYGRDGRVRSCELKAGNGSLLRRPIQLLVPLELGSSRDAAPRPEGVRNSAVP